MNSKWLLQRLPLTVLILWLVSVAILVWQRVCESPQPPFYDALSYLQKAKSFWDNVANGWPQNPLNLVQPGRPPGTVLLSYPFGFSNDYHGFLFRAVIMPFSIWISAILIASWPVRSINKPSSYWPPVLAAFLLGPLPFFFQFEYPAHAYWGMMDGFLASLAALAVACAGRSLMRKSWALLIAAAAIAAFCPLVKPSGSLILLLTSLFWSSGALVAVLLSAANDRLDNIRFWLFGTLVLLVSGGAISWLCINSEYISHDVISHFKQSMAILRSETATSITFPIFKLAIQALFGPQVIILVVLVVFLAIKRIKIQSFQPPTWFLLISSLLFLSVGIWFMLFSWGVSQFRFFYPFAVMLIVPLVIIAFRKIYKLDRALPPIARWGVPIVCILPAINLIGLLAFQNPNDKWQEFSGVSMKIGSGKAGVQIAENLLQELESQKKSAVVYTISQTEECYAFNCYGWYRNIIHPAAYGFNTLLPLDWQRPSTYRIPEILACNYILFEPVSGSQQEKALKVDKTNSCAEEETLIEAFLSSLKPEDGIKTRFENQSCRLSEIIDPSRLSEAFSSFIKTKSWRPLFLKENETAALIESKSLSIPVEMKLQEPNCKLQYSFDNINLSTSKLTITGWGFIEGMSSDSLNFYILLKNNDNVLIYNAPGQIRRDITTGFRQYKVNLDSSGFKARIPVGNLERGNYQVGLYVMKGNHTGSVISDQYIYIDK